MPESREPQVPSKIPVLDEVGECTTRVSTGMLVRNGISTLRILSESQLRDILRRQEARVAAREASARSAGLDGDVDQALAKAYESRWAELKNRHEQSLNAVEARMEKLSRAFQGLSGVIGKLEGETAGATEPRPAAAHSTPPERQKTLLRQLLLNGETSAK